MEVDTAYVVKSVLRCIFVAAVMGLILGGGAYSYSGSGEIGMVMGLGSASLFMMNGGVVPLPKL